MASKKKIFILVIIILIAAPATIASIYKISPLAWNIWGPVNAAKGVAIKGHDPVAYFVLGKAQMGDPSITINWNSVDWHFSSNEHRSLFESNPEKYAPQFGGYCATAISIGMTADIDPNSWHIENEKLYLFFNEEPKLDYIAGINDGIIQRSEQKWLNK